MSTVRTPFAGNSRTNRSAISNGSWKLEGVDNRSAEGRRYRDLCSFYADDLGGAANLTEPQRGQIRQLAAVTIESEKLQSLIVRGEPIDHEALVRLTNLVARLIKQLGIKPASAKRQRSPSEIFANRRGAAA